MELRHLGFSKEKLKRMLQTGLPAGVQSSIFSIANVLIQSSVNSFGATVVAGNAAAANLEGFVYISMNALYQTCLSFTSQNLGAQKFRRIDQVLVRCALIVSVIGLVLGNGAHLLGPHLLALYSNDDQVIFYGMIRLSVVAAPYCLCGMMEVVSGSVRGLGYSILPTLVSLAGACLFRIIWIFTVFQQFRTLLVLYLSWPISWVLTVSVHLICYLIIRRKVFDLSQYAWFCINKVPTKFVGTLFLFALDVLYDLLDVGYFLVAETCHLQVSPVIQTQHIVCAHGKIPGQPDEHLDGRLDVVVLPVRGALLCHPHGLGHVHLGQPPGLAQLSNPFIKLHVARSCQILRYYYKISLDFTEILLVFYKLTTEIQQKQDSHKIRQS